MAQKRSSPKDFDSSPPVLKQPRLATASPTHPTAQPFIVPAQRPNVLGLPGTPPSSLAELPVGVVPKAAPAMRPPGMFSLPVSPHVLASYRIRPPTVPVICPTVTPQRPPVVLSTPPVMTPSSVPFIPPPPYSVSMVIPATSETPQEQPENTCLSPSQFLYHPGMLQSPASSLSSTTGTSPTVVTSTVTMTSLIGSRQPVCTTTAVSIAGSLKGKENSKMSIKENNKMSIKEKRAKLLKAYKRKSASLKLKYEVQLKEKFFLEGGSNLMDFVLWKKKPNILRDQYLDRNKLETGGTIVNEDHLLSPKDDSQMLSLRRTSTDEVIKESLKHSSTLKDSKSLDIFKSPPTMTAPTTVSSASLSTTVQIPLSTVSPGVQNSTPKQLTPTSLNTGLSFETPSPRPAMRTQMSFSSVLENSHEDIVMRARHEADVKKAIAELRREGLWSACRLPKVMEPSRQKTHWDYLLEEMQWLATDFVNERKWKINAAKKVSYDIFYHSCV